LKSSKTKAPLVLSEFNKIAAAATAEIKVKTDALNKWAAPEKGKFGFLCERKDKETPRPECLKTNDKESCCAAIIPAKADKQQEDWTLKVLGRSEVCITTDTKEFIPTEYVRTTPYEKYSVMCIQGAMKMVASATVVASSIFMMQ